LTTRFECGKQQQAKRVRKRGGEKKSGAGGNKVHQKKNKPKEGASGERGYGEHEKRKKGVGRITKG